MLAVWAIAAALILLHTRTVHAYVSLLNGLALRGAAEPHTPMRQIIPAQYADAMMWTRFALDAAEKGDTRVRFTTNDNAPFGREVHWSSGFSWLLRAAAVGQQTFTGEPRERAIEHALLWFNAPLLLAITIALSAWAARQAGAGTGVLVALGLIGHRRIYEGFAPAYVDHHGLVAAALLGLVLGVIFMGAGWWKPADAASLVWLPGSRERVRRAATISALCGAAGLWISAASTLPVIALLGAATVIVAWWTGPAAARAGAMFEPAAWQRWGRVGAATSAAFYLLEYAPNHFGWRLEVNHPLWSLAWWGGAELVALLSPLARDRRSIRTAGWKIVLAFLAIAAAPLAILVGGAATFMVRDPFVADLRHYVSEGMSLPALVREHGFRPVAWDLLSTLLLVPAVVLLMRRRPGAPLLLGVATIAAAAFALLACAEMRWWANAGVAQLALLLVLIGCARPQRRAACIAASGAVLVGLALQRVVTEQRENQRHAVTANDLMMPVYRDIAAVLREAQPAGGIVLLADPNASAAIGYFARGQAIGTLYWENTPGLRAAAKILCARTDDEAAQLIRERGITHVAVISTANFIGEYFRLLHPDASRTDVESCFAARITREPPRWLQPMAYRIPEDVKSAVQFVRLFKVAFEQTEVEWLYHRAVARGVAGDAAAEPMLADALARTTAADRFALCEAAASAFYENGADALAVRMFRRALELRDDPLVASTLAWILATTSDAQLRDGRAALALVAPRLRAHPDDPTLLSSFAAASAEMGRFADAVAAAERALAQARPTGDHASEKLLQQRLDTYRSGRPWRQ